jgi:hypothetical protein
MVSLWILIQESLRENCHNMDRNKLLGTCLERTNYEQSIDFRGCTRFERRGGSECHGHGRERRNNPYPIRGFKRKRNLLHIQRADWILRGFGNSPRV